MARQLYEFGKPDESARFELIVEDGEPIVLLDHGKSVKITATSLRLLHLLIRREIHASGHGAGSSRHRYNNQTIASMLGARETDPSSFARTHIENVRKALADSAPFKLIQNHRDIGYWFSGKVALRGEPADVVNEIAAPATAPLGSPPAPHQQIFIGRDSDLDNLLSRLSLEPSSATPSQTIVTGLPGVGKTTLASVLAYDPQIARAFPDGVLWTSLDQNPSLMSILGRWGRVLGRDDVLSIPTVDEATAALRAGLGQKRMLLLVDDVWDAGHGALFQKLGTHTCSLLFTTRLPKVAEGLARSREDIYVLAPLSVTDSVNLMSRLAPEVVAAHPEPCRQLIADLECLPLAIHVAARLLRIRKARGLRIDTLIEEVRQGSAVMEASAPCDLVKDGAIPTVKSLFHRSTDLLDAEARRCFIALGAFAPKPASFDLEAMTFVCEVPDATAVAETLIDQGLLEPRGNGRFQMHALLVAHANGLAAQEMLEARTT